MDKVQKVQEVLTRYGLFDRKVVMTRKGVVVFLPASCRNASNENLFDDLADAVNDRLGVTIMNVYNGMGAEEYVRRNREILERTGIL